VVVQDRGVADAASAALVERQEGTDMRRRRKYTWFPSNLSPIRGESVDTRVNLNGITGGLAVDGTVQGITTLPLCISDFVNTGSNYEGTIVDPLSEVVGQEYVVERIVGKFFAWTHWAPNTTNSLDASVAVGLGLCVARAEESTDSTEWPIGSQTVQTAVQNYSPLVFENTREPWMFRRTWMLGARNIDANKPDQFGSSAFPPTTAGYGSLQDGPHVDVKSVRRVRQDERLWAIIAVERYPFGLEVEPAQEIELRFWFDYRILGQLRRAKNRSNF